MGTHLHTHFRQIHLHGELLAGVDIGVVRLLEGTFQFMQLVRGEGGAIASVLLLGAVLILACRGEREKERESYSYSI